MSKIVVLSRELAEQFSSDQPWACISISGRTEGQALINQKNLVDCLFIQFDDVTMLLPEYKLFSTSQANQILDFVIEVWDKIETLMIHCHAGASRSPAVAAIISKIYYHTDKEYFDKYDPNKLVYNRLYEAANRRPDLPSIW